MKNYIHYAGVAITNSNRSQFYLQRNSPRHPLFDYRSKLCFFGGIVRDRESFNTSLSRELHKNLGKETVDIIIPELTPVFVMGSMISGDYDMFSLYECALSCSDFNLVAASKAKEGAGIVVGRNKFKGDNFIPPLERVLAKYLEFIEE